MAIRMLEKHRTAHSTVKVRSHGPMNISTSVNGRTTSYGKVRKGTEYDKDGSVTATFSEGFKTLAN